MESEALINNQSRGNAQKHSLKAFLYTFLLFLLVIVGWIYTSPLFNEKKDISEEGVLSQDTSQKLDSIGQSFKTMWSEVTK